jgi:hypothetical protein
MGDVLEFKRPEPRRKRRDRDIGPASPQLIDDMYWLVNALKVGDVEIVPECDGAEIPIT